MGEPRILVAGGGTGGHLVPALNLGEALRRTDPGVRLFYLGGERGIESRVLPERGVEHRLLPLQPLYRRAPWRNWRLVSTAPAVLRGLRQTFAEFDPHLVLGTGGYVSGPAVWWGSRSGRVTAIQEQNASPGLVSRLLASRVDQVHLGFPEAETELRPGSRTSVYAYGNPVAIRRGGAPDFEWPEGRVVLVTGGSQGARGLNRRLLTDLEAAEGAGEDRVVAAAAAPGPSAREGPGASASVAPPDPSSGTWPTGWRLVWIAGPTHAEEVSERVGRLKVADRICVVPFIEDLGRQLGSVDLAISRAGAMTVSELALSAVPTIFVPFPAAAGGHQTPNARAMVDAGAAELREESELAPGELWDLTRSLAGDRDHLRRMAEAAGERARPDAADMIARELLAALETGGDE